MDLQCSTVAARLLRVQPGMDAAATYSDGKTALTLTSDRQHSEIIQMLQQALTRR